MSASNTQRINLEHTMVYEHYKELLTFLLIIIQSTSFIEALLNNI